MARQTKEFISNAKKFWIDRKKGIVRLSPIFKWFADDFVASYGRDEKIGDHGKNTTAVLNFLTRNLDQTDAAYIEKGEYEIKYLNYDWTLNEQRKKQNAKSA